MMKPISLPTESSARTALRIQQVIAYETDITTNSDPLGGSYFIEDLTNKIETEVYKYFEIIDEKGGVLNCIEEGYLQKEIQESAYKYQLEIEHNDRIIVGVNKFIVEETDAKPIMKVKKELELKQVEHLKTFKNNRNLEQVNKALNDLENIAKTEENLFPYILAAVKAYATLGEICDVFRNIFGEFKPKLSI